MMNRTQRIYMGIGALVTGALLAVASFYVWHSRPRMPADGEAVPHDSRTLPDDQVTVENPEIRHTEGGRTAWQVRLRELTLGAGAQVATAADMREALIYDRTGKPLIRVTARQAVGNTTDRNLTVSGNVRAVSQHGALITTEEVRWLEAERRFHCPGTVTVRTRNASLTTTGLDYHVDEEIIRCPNIVRMYSGSAKLAGRDLVYNVTTGAYEMKNVQAVFNVDEAREALRTPPEF